MYKHRRTNESRAFSVSSFFISTNWSNTFIIRVRANQSIHLSLHGIVFEEDDFHLNLFRFTSVNLSRHDESNGLTPLIEWQHQQKAEMIDLEVPKPDILLSMTVCWDPVHEHQKQDWKQGAVSAEANSQKNQQRKMLKKRWAEKMLCSVWPKHFSSL